MKNPVDDKKKSSGRVRRGGRWGSGAGYTRVSGRRFYDPSYRYNHLGFRIVRNKGKTDEKSSN